MNALEAQQEGPSLSQLGLRRIIEELLEAEVSDRLGRGYYERGSDEGERNGYRRGRLKTAEGEVEYSVPQVRGLEEPFRSRIRPELGKRTEALEDLAVEMYARGLSTRDIEAALCDEKGRSLLSRTAVSQVTERLWEEYEAFASRDLSEYDIAYLFADEIAERLHGGQRREAVLCAWGITTEGQKVLLHLSPGTKEDTEGCRAFFQDLSLALQAAMKSRTVRCASLTLHLPLHVDRSPRECRAGPRAAGRRTRSGGSTPPRGRRRCDRCRPGSRRTGDQA